MMNLRVPWFIIGFILGVLDGALLAVSTVLLTEMPRSEWAYGIVVATALPMFALWVWFQVRYDKSLGM